MVLSDVIEFSILLDRLFVSLLYFEVNLSVVELSHFLLLLPHLLELLDVLCLLFLTVIQHHHVPHRELRCPAVLITTCRLPILLRRFHSLRRERRKHAFLRGQICCDKGPRHLVQGIDRGVLAQLRALVVQEQWALPDVEWATRILRKNALGHHLGHGLVHIDLELLGARFRDILLRIEGKGHETRAERVTNLVFVAMRSLRVPFYLLEIICAILNTVADADG